MTPTKVNRIAYTPGEPGGIGADLILMLAQHPFDAEVVVFGCAEQLSHRAKLLNLNIKLHEVDFNKPAQKNGLGHLSLYPIPLEKSDVIGEVYAGNRASILESLKQAFSACYHHQCQALVTGPVQKSVLSTPQEPFHGHTEFLAHCAYSHQSDLKASPTMPEVMMAFHHPSIMVGLVTTHIALQSISQTITKDLIKMRTHHLHRALQTWFKKTSPRIGVLGLNPHAGESGQMGHEEIETIEPAIADLQAQGMNIFGPIPGDSAFIPGNLKQYDGLLAMYHDQGLGPLKAMGFGKVVNITLGLPILRTSVDHGTAFPLAGTGKANPEGLLCALKLATDLSS